jgi:cysteine desulfuration protein SufE
MSLLEELQTIDRSDYLQFLVEIGEDIDFPSEHKTEENLVSGCASKTWVKVFSLNGTLKISAYSESSVVSGLVFTLLDCLNGLSDQQILAFSGNDFLEQFRISEFVSPQRCRGILSVLDGIKKKVLDVLP